MMTKNLRYVLVVIVTGMLGCRSGQPKRLFPTEAGTFKVTILYPNGEGKTFDFDYYENHHMPMVAGFLGNNLKFYEIDKGLSGRTQGDKIPFLAIGYFYVSDTAEYNKSVAQHREAIVGDFKNYTNVQPVIQFSAVRQVRARGNQ